MFEKSTKLIYMEIFKKAFSQVTVPPFSIEESKNGIKIDKLLSLIINEDYKQDIIAHYQLDDLQQIIPINNIDKAFKYIEYVHNKYDYENLWGNNNEVNPYFEQSKDDESQTDLYFNFKALYDDEGYKYENINAKLEYDASTRFFHDRELSKYVNFLKSKKGKAPSNINDKNSLIEDITASWNKYYTRNPKSIPIRKFRFLKDQSGKYFLRSITSERYKEYGVAFSFVISMIAFHKAMEADRGLTLSINSLSLNESKIDMLISSGHAVFVEEIDRFITSTVLVQNNDLGNRSLSFTHSLKLTPVQNDQNKIYLFPNLKEQNIDYKNSASHSSDIETVLKTFDNIQSVLYSVEEYIKDFKGFTSTHSPDQLRAKIEEKIISNNSPYKDIKELKDLFKRSTTQHINNLAKLLEICQKAEMIDMEYDLKFKLRYLISNVLLHGRQN